jgi:hypothetical protein
MRRMRRRGLHQGRQSAEGMQTRLARRIVNQTQRSA